jgi:hypothetical protein
MKKMIAGHFDERFRVLELFFTNNALTVDVFFDFSEFDPL